MLQRAHDDHTAAALQPFIPHLPPLMDACEPCSHGNRDLPHGVDTDLNPGGWKATLHQKGAALLHLPLRAALK